MNSEQVPRATFKAMNHSWNDISEQPQHSIFAILPLASLLQ